MYAVWKNTSSKLECAALKIKNHFLINDLSCSLTPYCPHKWVVNLPTGVHVHLELLVTLAYKQEEPEWWFAVVTGLTWPPMPGTILSCTGCKPLFWVTDHASFSVLALPCFLFTLLWLDKLLNNPVPWRPLPCYSVVASSMIKVLNHHTTGVLWLQGVPRAFISTLCY